MHEKSQAGFIISIVALVMTIALVIVTWFPLKRPPNFRYTGSDPSRDVWNIGLPLAHFTYDPIHGLQIGPTAYAMLPLNVFAMMFVVVLCRVRAIQRRRKLESLPPARF